MSNNPIQKQNEKLDLTLNFHEFDRGSDSFVRKSKNTTI